ncbi:nucleotidyltransferase domain-containing protein [Vogesella sp. LIG4]|uniref:nucleotidyltransferase domain-containing protein n=1 Tax=Vogesella sp. LIG4 TaxID=1192162 RepID=UPI0008200765|nr:nucleotidyltransferase domain-containing protein [Vogesella sp. LIG4]SCK22119.1 Predicted nucleotidyltransferases [Vogesella sp. LIG4]
MSTATESVLQGISHELQQQYGASAVLLYGSHADGSAGPDSDYDIAVLVRSVTGTTD